MLQTIQSLLQGCAGLLRQWQARRALRWRQVGRSRQVVAFSRAPEVAIAPERGGDARGESLHRGQARVGVAQMILEQVREVRMATAGHSDCNGPRIEAAVGCARNLHRKIDAVAAVS